MTDYLSARRTETSLTRPSVARIYDYLLGGSHNFEVDRVAARTMISAAPDVITAAMASRAFLRRVVTFAVDRGIYQFLDLGSGIPTVGSVHETAFARNRAARVVYVDHDPIAVAHAQIMLADDPRVTVIGEDIQSLPRILNQLEDILDFQQPVAVLLVAVAHFIAGDMTALLAPLRHVLPDGSLLAISHASFDLGASDAQRSFDVRKAHDAAPGGIHLRPEAQIREMFTGFTLIPGHRHAPNGEPRLVTVDAWQPDPADYPRRPVTGFLAGVGIREPQVAATSKGTS